MFEDGYTPGQVLKAEAARRQAGLSAERVFFGAGGAFIGPRSSLEAAYKACYFHNGSMDRPEDVVETMKICLDDPSKQSLPGFINWFLNQETGPYILGCYDEPPSIGHIQEKSILYDGISNPGKPYFNPDYNPSNLTMK